MKTRGPFGLSCEDTKSISWVVECVKEGKPTGSCKEARSISSLVLFLFDYFGERAKDVLRTE